MAPEHDEQERRQIIGRLERQYQQAQAKGLKAEAEGSDARGEEAALLDAHRRAQLPFPPGDICSECWITHRSFLPPVDASCGTRACKPSA